jgi:hypothetical protein
MDKDGDIDVLGGSESSSGIMWYENTLYSAESDLDSQGSLSWIDVKPGSTVTGSFTISNIGLATSSLQWKIQDYPDWGTWTFTPQSGRDLTPEMGDVSIDVLVEVPNDKNQEFSGDVTIINTQRPNDVEKIQVSLATMKHKQNIQIKFPFLYDLFFRNNNVLENLLLSQGLIQENHDGR